MSKAMTLDDKIKELKMTDQPTPKALTFTEAPVSWNVRYIVDGYDCQLTIRDMDTSHLFERVTHAIEWLSKNGANGTRVSAPALQQTTEPIPTSAQQIPPAPITASEQQEIVEVNIISHGQTDNGVHYILVKGGKYSKFGVKCWEDKVPVIASRFKEWPVGQTYDPPEGMELAVVSEVMKDGKSHKKVTAFLSK